jgi:hypothetical protein
MSELAKINRIVHQFELTAPGQQDVFTIDPRNLNAGPGGNLYNNFAQGKASYLLDIKLLRTSGTQTHDGAYRRVVGCAIVTSLPIASRVITNPDYANQANPANFDDYIAALNMNLRVTGRSSDDPAAIDGSINIINTETDTPGFLPARYRMFVDIFGWGNDD